MRSNMVCTATSAAMGATTIAETGASASATARRIGGQVRAALFALLLVVSVVLCASGAGAVSKAYADDAPSCIGVVSVGDENHYASSYKALREELAKQKGKQVTVEMRCNWDARSA